MRPRFGKLVVMSNEGINKHGQKLCRCLCDCGKETVVPLKYLQIGHTTSCGCLKIDNAKILAKRNIVHGHALLKGRSKEYFTWIDMKRRCINPKRKDFKYYGGRGIEVCAQWLHSFENFLQYLKSNSMYPKPAGMSIDRINNNGNYEPGNIRWSTQSQQNYNRRLLTC